MSRRTARPHQVDPNAKSFLCSPGEAIFGLVLFFWGLTVLAVPVVLAVIETLLFAAVLYLFHTRVWWMLHTAAIKRRWLRAATGAKIRRIERVPTGEQLDVRIRPGGSIKHLQQRSGPDGELAARLRVGQVRVRGDRMDGSRATVVLVRNDPFIAGESLAWPHLNTPVLSLRDRIPIGVSDEGHQVLVTPFEMSLLVGGVPKAGKSTLLHIFIATAVRDPNCEKWLFDGKEEVEFAPWTKAATRVVGSEPQDALGSLRELKELMNIRLRTMKAEGWRILPPDADLPLYLVVVDELACYLNELPQKKQRDDFETLLRALVSRGRAAGIIPIVATQKPHHQVVSTSLRDLFNTSCAFRCATPPASDTILGQGWASQGFDASTVPGGQHGVGFLLSEAALPIRFKGYHLTDADVERIAEQATQRDAEQWIDNATAPPPHPSLPSGLPPTANG